MLARWWVVVVQHTCEWHDPNMGYKVEVDPIWQCFALTALEYSPSHADDDASCLSDDGNREADENAAHCYCGGFYMAAALCMVRDDIPGNCGAQPDLLWDGKGEGRGRGWG